MRITFVTRKFGNVERNSHCDVLHITPVRVARLFLDCIGVFAIKAYILFLALSAFITDLLFGDTRKIRPNSCCQWQPIKESLFASRMTCQRSGCPPYRVTTALTTRRWRHGRNANVVIHCVITVAVKRRRDQLWSRTRGK